MQIQIYIAGCCSSRNGRLKCSNIDVPVPVLVFIGIFFQTLILRLLFREQQERAIGVVDLIDGIMPVGALSDLDPDLLLTLGEIIAFNILSSPNMGRRTLTIDISDFINSGSVLVLNILSLRQRNKNLKSSEPATFH